MSVMLILHSVPPLSPHTPKPKSLFIQILTLSLCKKGRQHRPAAEGQEQCIQSVLAWWWCNARSLFTSPLPRFLTGQLGQI